MQTYIRVDEFFFLICMRFFSPPIFPFNSSHFTASMKGAKVDLETWPDTVHNCQTPDIGLRLGVDFTLLGNDNDTNKKDTHLNFLRRNITTLRLGV